MTSLPVSQS